jgi:hypothetical protein
MDDRVQAFAFGHTPIPSFVNESVIEDTTYQQIDLLVVEPAHPGSSPRLGTDVHICLDLFQNLTAICFKW